VGTYYPYTYYPNLLSTSTRCSVRGYLLPIHLLPIPVVNLDQVLEFVYLGTYYPYTYMVSVPVTHTHTRCVVTNTDPIAIHPVLRAQSYIYIYIYIPPPQPPNPKPSPPNPNPLPSPRTPQPPSKTRAAGTQVITSPYPTPPPRSYR